MSEFRAWRRQLGRLIAAAAVGAAVIGAIGQITARAESPSPYDMKYATFSAPSGVPMRSAMQDGASVVGTIPAGGKGIVMRWCRPEFPFGAWQFGGAKMQRQLLDQRWCEVSYKGKIGNVDGHMLAPE
ncbi:hypothetical protein HDIA_1791 [Hartmannibacter diazotrophicus]|uniref:SH3 domain-containing protein n=1 Tax=Hartmannibacter diazotrophicus TaxID=1482074 RepID=A0A2C9D4S2_9HYPH|nr:hypothetical protein [Hartmannibacter diazotrophicus]SON55332.1 hypothetical protein HDIA_1791 [Hartmannibacter diazotrophicus]